MNDFGKRLKEERTYRGWSQARMARNSGGRLIQHSISQYETGSRMPSLYSLGAVCDMFEMTLDDFFKIHDSKYEKRFKPEKVVERDEELARCPCCNGLVEKKRDVRQNRFCRCCGQALDWEP